MDIKAFASAVSQIASEKEISQEKIVEIIEQAIATAYKKEYRERGEIIKAKVDLKTGLAKFWLVKTVVDETTVIFADEGAEDAEEDIETEEGKTRYNPKRHITIEEAKRVANEMLHTSLMGIVNRRYSSNEYEFFSEQHTVNSFKVEKSYGTSLVALCWISYIYPSE